MLRKIISLLFYLLVFLLPWQARLFITKGQLNNGYWEYGTISIYLIDILLIILLLLAALLYFFSYLNKRTIKKNKFWFLIAGLDLFVFLSIFFAADKVLALYHYILFLLAIGLFWLIISIDYNFLVFVYSFLLGVFFRAVLGIIEFLSQSSFANSWLGLAKHQANNLGVSVIETQTGRWLRAYGGLDHPNVLGGLLVISIILTLGLVVKNQAQKFRWFMALNYFFILIFTAALFFTFSRASWLALFGSVMIMLILGWHSFLKQKTKINIRRLTTAITVIIGLVIILGGFYKNIISTRLNSQARLEVKSRAERVELYKQSFYLVKKHFLIGAGIGNYTLAVHNEINPLMPGWWYQPVHNVFLLVLTEIGLVGFLFFLSLFFYLIWQGRKLKAQEGIIFWPLMAALIIMLSFDHWWWSLHFGLLFFWLCFGVLAGIKNWQQFER